MIFCGLGLVIPQAANIPTWVVVLSLASGVFMACFGIRIQELSQLHPTRILGFYVARFIIVPVVAYHLLAVPAPTQALAVFLLAACPPGISAPAMNRLFGGNISLGFVLTLVGNLLIPLILPFMLFELVGHQAELDTRGMVQTLLLTILAPMFVFLCLRKNRVLHKFIDIHGAYLTILFIGLTIAIAVAKHRTMILDAPLALIPLFLLGLGCFGFFYLFGWFFYRRESRRNKIAQSLSSGAINISLGVTLALLYFPPEISLFLIVAEIPWILALMPFKNLILRHRVA